MTTQFQFTQFSADCKVDENGYFHLTGSFDVRANITPSESELDHEIYARFGPAKESEWIGHSAKVRENHYDMITDDDFESAANWEIKLQTRNFLTRFLTHKEQKLVKISRRQIPKQKICVFANTVFVTVCDLLLLFVNCY